MAVARVDGNTDLWFFMSRDSQTVNYVRGHSRVQIQSLDGWTFCVVYAGVATALEDGAMIHAIWKPFFKVWFPVGADDLSIVFLHITGEQAEYCDNTGANPICTVYDSFAALVKGNTPEIMEGELHGNVTLAK